MRQVTFLPAVLADFDDLDLAVDFFAVDFLAGVFLGGVAGAAAHMSAAIPNARNQVNRRCIAKRSV